MLEQLLAEIQRGGTLEVRSLAERLRTSPAMIEVLLQHLAEMGRLQTTDACRPQSCSGCSLAAGCSAPGVKLWRSSP